MIIKYPNILQLKEVDDYEAKNCLPAMNLIRKTKLRLTSKPSIPNR